MGLAITPEYDELLARGYPHLRRLVEHPDEADAERWAIAALDESDPKRYHVDWPAAVARRYVRGYAKSRIENTSDVARNKAAVDTGPVTEKEGRALIAAYLHPNHYDRYDFHAEHALYLVEAMIGSAATADAVLSEFEKLKKLDSKFGTRTAMAYALGFVIRRLPAKQRAAANARVSAIVAKHREPENYVRDFLSYLVGGRKALEDSGRTLGLYCVHFCNDPALIREVAADSVVGWDAQHVVLAGDELIDAVRAKFRQVWPAYKPRVIDQLGILASPKALAALREVGSAKALATRVAAALALRSGTPANGASAKATKPKPKPKAKPGKATKRKAAASAG